jgi:hypothetical protein
MASAHASANRWSLPQIDAGLAQKVPINVPLLLIPRIREASGYNTGLTRVAVTRPEE